MVNERAKAEETPPEASERAKAEESPSNGSERAKAEETPSEASEPPKSGPAKAEPVQTDADLRRLLAPRPTYEITRFVFLRLLGALYSVAFLVLILQGGPLLGSHGLLPAARFVERATASLGVFGAFSRAPSIFFLIGASDLSLTAFAWIGFVLSVLVALGLTNAIAQLVIWAIYLSFVHVGQVFYGYGWEMQLCETGFLAVFLCPVYNASPLPETRAPTVPIWLLRWLIARIMWGAGLIKLRGDPCWVDLTCLAYHYETQPIPNPLTPLFHSLPLWAHKAGALVSHAVELIAPFFAFGPRKARHIAGCAFIAFQLILILSGNLSFLNWLTILPAIACFDDSILSRIVPARLKARLAPAAEREPGRAANLATYAYGLVVVALSINPVLNLLSPRQAMNTSFEPFKLVNTYGAFGSVGKERFEIILSGTTSDEPGPEAEWRAYELPCKPGDPARRPCFASPYHYRLDWQIWFAAFRGYRREPWLVFFVYKLLQGDPGARSLLGKDPFPDAPPKFIRADLYRYELIKIGEDGPGWWRRTRVNEVFRPLSLDDPEMLRFLSGQRFL